jgi:hypothetical protein
VEDGTTTGRSGWPPGARPDVVVARTYDRAGESPAERLDRNWNELLQELRVAQTGTQILFAFLLGIAFTGSFQQADNFTHAVYSVTLVLAGLATGLLIAPVAVHRQVFRKGLKRELVSTASRLASGGLFLLMLTVAGGLLVALDVVMPRAWAVATVVGVLVWFATFWYGLPVLVRRRADAVDR